MKEEMGEKKMSPMGNAKKEVMKKMGKIAGKKAKMAMKPSMMY